MKRFCLLAIILFTYVSTLNAPKQPLKPVSIPTYQTTNITSTESTEYEQLEVLAPGSFKAYMDYRKITDKTSNQYRFIQENLKVTESGFLTTDDEYIAVALGSYFGPIGSKYTIQLDTGSIINVVKTDEKNDIHTDSVNHFVDTHNHSVIEFIIDTKAPYMQKYLKYGDLSYIAGLKGNIITIWKGDTHGDVTY